MSTPIIKEKIKSYRPLSMAGRLILIYNQDVVHLFSHGLKIPKSVFEDMIQSAGQSFDNPLEQEEAEIIFKIVSDKRKAILYKHNKSDTISDFVRWSIKRKQLYVGFLSMFQTGSLEEDAIPAIKVENINPNTFDLKQFYINTDRIERKNSNEGWSHEPPTTY